MTTVPTTTRPIDLPDALPEYSPTAPRTEYGALVVQTGTIYMHDPSLSVVQAFITEMSTVTPIALVTRQWAGTEHGAWKEESK